jgi:hypothetical protein
VPDAHPAHHGEVGVRVPQFTCRVVYGDERSVAAGVHAVAGAGEAEEVRDAGGKSAGDVADHGEGADLADEGRIAVRR